MLVHFHALVLPLDAQRDNVAKETILYGVLEWRVDCLLGLNEYTVDEYA